MTLITYFYGKYIHVHIIMMIIKSQFFKDGLVQTYRGNILFVLPGLLVAMIVHVKTGQWSVDWNVGLDYIHLIYTGA